MRAEPRRAARRSHSLRDSSLCPNRRREALKALARAAMELERDVEVQAMSACWNAIWAVCSIRECFGIGDAVFVELHAYQARQVGSEARGFDGLHLEATGRVYGRRCRVQATTAMDRATAATARSRWVLRCARRRRTSARTNAATPTDALTSPDAIATSSNTNLCLPMADNVHAVFRTCRGGRPAARCLPTLRPPCHAAAAGADPVGG